ncbi:MULTISPECIES: hypothetical protein [unclassified Pseudomonas]|uniref:hypothetical protein n=1 Tax=unclassified Pseudomonas TaxID=196821 RepID=UPI000726D1A4|nr:MULTISPECIES: hypothetical protein [unclassified Pseudomonas]KQN42156.1 hypothetical protein ASE98_13195 [Pseudomonas sp. Leaf48]MDR6925103.1 hypothetical protein [Pseudomonas sp. BE134]
MYWFRRHRQSLLHLTLVVWVLAVAVMAIQGCLVQTGHNVATPHTAEQYLQPDHVLHANGCLQTCEDVATAIKPSSQIPVLDPINWVVLLLLTAAVLLLIPEEKFSFAALQLKRPAPPGRPARLTFVRSND